MSIDAIVVLAIAGCALLLFISDLLAADLVALLVLLALGLSGILDTTTLFSGFGHPVILTLIGIFMLVGALQNTGLNRYISLALLRVTRFAGQRALIGLLSLAAALMAAMMNTVAAVALVAPIGIMVANRRNISPSRLLLPIAFGALLGGMTTLLTTANLIMSGLLQKQIGVSLALFDFAPVGGPIALLGILYLTIFSHVLLPERSPSEQYGAMQQARQELTQTYRLSLRLFEAFVQPGGPIPGKPLNTIGLGEEYGITVAAIVRGRQIFAPPQPDMRLLAEDWLLIEGRPDETRQAAAALGLTLHESNENQQALLVADTSELAEITLNPRSGLVGLTLQEIGFRKKYGLNVLGIWHGSRPIRSYLATHRLQLGNALLVQGTADNLNLLARDADFLVLTHIPEINGRPERMLTAVGILVAFLIVIAFRWVPTSLAAVMAGVAVVLTGCQTIEQARNSIQWQTLFLIGGMLPLAVAVEQTGLTAMIVTGLEYIVGGGGMVGWLAAFFILTASLAQLTSGQAAALIIGPLAISSAVHNGLNPQAIAIVVGIAASTGFLSPMAHPGNLIVLGPGGYRFGDYARLGIPLMLLTLAGVLILTPLLYPF